MQRRDLILGERIMYADAKTPVNCSFTATIRGRPDAESLRLALDKLQSRHPLLRACIREGGNGRPYFIFDEKMRHIPIRTIDRLADDDWVSASESEWATPFDMKEGPLARLLWLRAGAVSELMIVCPHCICDGASIITLMRELLCFLDRPWLDLPSNDVSYSVREIISGLPSGKKGNIFKSFFQAVVTRVVISLRNGRGCAPRGKDYLVHWKLNEKATSLLMQRCKQEGVTVYAALCVSFLTAFGQVRKVNARNQVICPVNIRKLVPEIKDDMLFAFAPIVQLSVRKGESLDFWEKARLLKDDMNAKIESLNGYEQLQAGEYYHSSVKKIVQYLMTEDGTHDFTFSNMGRLDLPGEYRTFDVETIYSATVAFPWKNPTTLVVSTFKGEMDFSLISNTRWLSNDEAITIKGKGLALILEELAAGRPEIMG